MRKILDKLGKFVMHQIVHLTTWARENHEIRGILEQLKKELDKIKDECIKALNDYENLQHESEELTFNVKEIGKFSEIVKKTITLIMQIYEIYARFR